MSISIKLLKVYNDKNCITNHEECKQFKAGHKLIKRELISKQEIPDSSLLFLVILSDL